MLFAVALSRTTSGEDGPSSEQSSSLSVYGHACV